LDRRRRLSRVLLLLADGTSPTTPAGQRERAGSDLTMIVRTGKFSQVAPVTASLEAELVRV
jgi:hypothetical protein